MLGPSQRSLFIYRQQPNSAQAAVKLKLGEAADTFVAVTSPHLGEANGANPLCPLPPAPPTHGAGTQDIYTAELPLLPAGLRDACLDHSDITPRVLFKLTLADLIRLAASSRSLREQCSEAMLWQPAFQAAAAWVAAAPEKRVRAGAHVFTGLSRLYPGAPQALHLHQALEPAVAHCIGAAGDYLRARNAECLLMAVAPYLSSSQKLRTCHACFAGLRSGDVGVTEGSAALVTHLNPTDALAMAQRALAEYDTARYPNTGLAYFVLTHLHGVLPSQARAEVTARALGHLSWEDDRLARQAVDYLLRTLPLAEPHTAQRAYEAGIDMGRLLYCDAQPYLDLKTAAAAHMPCAARDAAVAAALRPLVPGGLGDRRAQAATQAHAMVTLVPSATPAQLEAMTAHVTTHVLHLRLLEHDRPYAQLLLRLQARADDLSGAPTTRLQTLRDAFALMRRNILGLPHAPPIAPVIGVDAAPVLRQQAYDAALEGLWTEHAPTREEALITLERLMPHVAEPQLARAYQRAHYCFLGSRKRRSLGGVVLETAMRRTVAEQEVLYTAVLTDTMGDHRCDVLAGLAGRALPHHAVATFAQLLQVTAAPYANQHRTYPPHPFNNNAYEAALGGMVTLLPHLSRQQRTAALCAARVAMGVFDSALERAAKRLIEAAIAACQLDELPAALNPAGGLCEGAAAQDLC